MNGEDLLNNLRLQYNLKLRGEKLRRIVNRADKAQKLLLAKLFDKWNRIAKDLTGLNKRRDAILRGRVNKNELYKKMILAHKFNVWRAAAFKEDNLSRAEAIMRFLNLLTKKVLKPTKVVFLFFEQIELFQ